MAEVLAPEYARTSEINLEQTLRPVLGDHDLEYFENFLGTLSQIGRTVAPVLQRALPGAISGALGGASLGPAGMLAGAALGGLGSSGVLPRTAPGVPAPVVPQQPMVPDPALSAAPVLGGAPTAVGGSPAAAQLLSTMFRPEVLQALMSMVLGRAGASHVRVGETAVPLGAFTNLLASLAGQAAAEYQVAAAPQGESIPQYLLDSQGEFRCDPAVSEERAAVLLKMLEAADEDDDEEFDEEDDDEMFSEDDEYE